MSYSRLVIDSIFYIDSRENPAINSTINEYRASNRVATSKKSELYDPTFSTTASLEQTRYTIDSAMSSFKVLPILVCTKQTFNSFVPQAANRITFFSSRSINLFSRFCTTLQFSPRISAYDIDRLVFKRLFASSSSASTTEVSSSSSLSTSSPSPAPPSTIIVTGLGRYLHTLETFISSKILTEFHLLTDMIFLENLALHDTKISRNIINTTRRIRILRTLSMRRCVFPNSFDDDQHRSSGFSVMGTTVNSNKNNNGNNDNNDDNDQVFLDYRNLAELDLSQTKITDYHLREIVFPALSPSSSSSTSSSHHHHHEYRISQTLLRLNLFDCENISDQSCDNVISKLKNLRTLNIGLAELQSSVISIGINASKMMKNRLVRGSGWQGTIDRIVSEANKELVAGGGLYFAPISFASSFLTHPDSANLGIMNLTGVETTLRYFFENGFGVRNNNNTNTNNNNNNNNQNATNRHPMAGLTAGIAALRIQRIAGANVIMSSNNNNNTADTTTNSNLHDQHQHGPFNLGAARIPRPRALPNLLSAALDITGLRRQLKDLIDSRQRHTRFSFDLAATTITSDGIRTLFKNLSSLININLQNRVHATGATLDTFSELVAENNQQQLPPLKQIIFDGCVQIVGDRQNLLLRVIHLNNNNNNNNNNNASPSHPANCWSAIANFSSSLTHVSFAFTSICDDDLKDGWFSSLLLLEEVSFRGCIFITTQSVKEHFPNQTGIDENTGGSLLRRLDLSLTSCDPSEVIPILKSKYGSSLTWLSLANLQRFYDRHLRHFAFGFDCLRHLDVSQNFREQQRTSNTSFISDKGLMLLAQFQFLDGTTTATTSDCAKAGDDVANDNKHLAFEQFSSMFSLLKDDDFNFNDDEVAQAQLQEALLRLEGSLGLARQDFIEDFIFKTRDKSSSTFRERVKKSTKSNLSKTLEVLVLDGYEEIRDPSCLWCFERLRVVSTHECSNLDRNKLKLYEGMCLSSVEFGCEPLNNGVYFSAFGIKTQ